MLLWMNRSVDLEQTFINNLEWLILFRVWLCDISWFLVLRSPLLSNKQCTKALCQRVEAGPEAPASARSPSLLLFSSHSMTRIQHFVPGTCGSWTALKLWKKHSCLFFHTLHAKIQVIWDSWCSFYIFLHVFLPNFWICCNCLMIHRGGWADFGAMGERPIQGLDGPGTRFETRPTIALIVSVHWIGLRENLQETIDFPIKYGAFL